MASKSPSTSKPASVEDRLIFTQTADDDDAARDGRRSADGSDRPAGQASDNSYLQSAHQGGSGATDGKVSSYDGASTDGTAYTAEDADADASALLSTDDAGSFVYDAGALFPDLDMSGPASFSVEGPDWGAIDPATGLLTGAPGLESVGVAAFTVTATDAAGERFTATLEFTVESDAGAPVVTDVVVKASPEAPAQEDAPSEAVDSDPTADVVPDSSELAFDEITGDNPAPAQDAAPEAPAQDAAPSVSETPVQSAPSAPEAPTAEEPPAVEEPVAPPAPEPPVQSAPPAPEPPAAEEPPVVEEPVSPPPAPEPPVQVAPVSPVAPPAPPSPPEPPKAYNVINGTKNADFIVGTQGDDRITGGRGNDTMKGGAGDDEYVYKNDSNGADVFDDGKAGDGYDVVVASDAKVVIGVDGYNDGRTFTKNGATITSTGVDEFKGAGDTIVRDGGSARTLNFSNTKLGGILEVDAGGGNDKVIASDLSDASYRGGAGNDALTAGDADATWLYKGASNGSDTFVNGDGHSVAMAEGKGVVIGVDGYANGVDAFQGNGDTIVRDGGSSRTLSFSQTELNGVLEVDAGGGNDTLIASDLSDASYRGGAGNDSLVAGKADATWLYKGASNGSDTFVNGEGHSVAMAEGNGVVIGLNGYANGVDAFQGNGDTIVRDGGSSKTLDFSNTELKGVLEVDAGAGNDKVVASDLSDASYRGGAGNDALTAGKADATWLYKGASNGSDTFVNGEGHSVAQAEGKGVVIGVDGYANGVDAVYGTGDTIVRDGGSSRTLDFSNTELKGVLEVDAGAGNDKVVASDLSDGAYRGGAGNDALTAGKADATWLYKGANNGSDTFVNGEGHSVAMADGSGVVIGVDGYVNGVDAIQGAGDTIVRDGGSSRTLNFSNTELSGVLEIDAGAGNDAVTASDLSDAAYRGGAGNDSLTAGKADTTWLYSGANNGADTFVNGEGHSVALAQGSGVVIGVDGYANGVDAFQGNGDTIVRDGGSSRTLNFSNTELSGVLEVDAGAGNDAVTASDLSDAAYRGGAGNDSLTAGKADATWLYSGSANGADTFVNGEGHSVAMAEGKGVVIGVDGYADGVDAIQGAGDTIVRDGGSSRTMNFSNTELSGVLEIDAGAGNDAVTASNVSDASYRGGAGNDALTAGSTRSVWLYGSGDNGLDTFTNGKGVSVAQAEGKGVVIGLNGYANGVDGVHGAGDTILRDGGSSKALDFSKTAFKGVAEVDAGAGNDTVTASNLSEGAYRGGAGNDTMIAGDQRTVFVYGEGNNGLDSFTNGAGQSLAQAEGKGVVIGVNGFANGVDGVLGTGDTIIRDGGSSKSLDFSNTALKGVMEIDGGAGNDTITVSNLSETTYRGGAGNDVFVVQKGAASAVIADFDDSGNDRIDLSAFGSNRGALEKATSLVDADGDSQADDVQIDLSALGGEKGASLTLLNTDMNALNFAAKGDFTVAGDSGAKFAKGQTAMPGEGDVDQIFAFDMDTLDQNSGWTSSLDAPAPEADAFSDPSGLIVFEDGSDSIYSSINDSQWG